MGSDTNITLQHHLNNPLLSPDWVHLIARGQTVPIEPSCLWKVVQKKKLLFMDKELINEQLNQGAAVVLEGLDILDASINAFIGQLDAVRIALRLGQLRCIFSQRENEAYRGHRDSDDVLVIQISGEKRWHIFAPQQRRYFGNSPPTRAQMGQQIKEVVLQPGDALYLRAGVPHICQTVADHSLHLAFDLCDRTPNVEQITHEANTRYNHASADPYVPADQVLKKYITLLNAPEFQAELAAATQRVRNDAQIFRQRIGKSSGVNALSRFSSQSS